MQYRMILFGASDFFGFVRIKSSEQDFKDLYWTISKILFWNLYLEGNIHDSLGRADAYVRVYSFVVLEVHVPNMWSILISTVVPRWQNIVPISFTSSLASRTKFIPKLFIWDCYGSFDEQRLFSVKFARFRNFFDFAQIWGILESGYIWQIARLPRQGWKVNVQVVPHVHVFCSLEHFYPKTPNFGTKFWW